MAKRTPAELRNLAKQLMTRASEEEEKRYARIGRVAARYLDVKSEDFDFDSFKQEILAASKQ
ncbi:MAG: hypothetical protein NUW09_07030 [Deltaproteobacteria bacterium]|nr:hypothetical protein [Deltaproteobacteria bacterium]